MNVGVVFCQLLDMAPFEALFFLRECVVETAVQPLDHFIILSWPILRCAQLGKFSDPRPCPPRLLAWSATTRDYLQQPPR